MLHWAYKIKGETVKPMQFKKYAYSIRIMDWERYKFTFILNIRTSCQLFISKKNIFLIASFVVPTCSVSSIYRKRLYFLSINLQILILLIDKYDVYSSEILCLDN